MVVGFDLFLGNVFMVFFGFIYCLDVCLIILFDIFGWFDEVGEDVVDLNVVFIMIDLECDIVVVMEEYVSYFYLVI